MMSSLVSMCQVNNEKLLFTCCAKFSHVFLQAADHRKEGYVLYKLSQIFK